MLSQSQRAAILELNAQKVSKHEIARVLKVSRLTVREVLRSGSSEVPSLPRAEKYEPYRQQILALHVSCKGNLVRDFSASIVDPPPGAPAGTRALKLVPKSPQREYDWLMLEVDPRTLELRGLVTIDGQGGESSFSFTNLKENIGLADKEFTFRMPRGVDVVPDSPAR